MLLKKTNTKYIPPEIVKEWVNDVPDGELYGVHISDDCKVWATAGRYAHSSVSKSTSWHSFLAGDMNDLVTNTMGQEVLNEVIHYLTQQST